MKKAHSRIMGTMKTKVKGPSSAAVMAAILCFLASTALLQAEPLQGEAKDRFVRRMARVYKETGTIQADFRETRSLKQLPKPLTFRGRIYLDLKQDFLFMDYLEPNRHVVRVQNGTVLFYVRGQATADVFDLTKAPGGSPSGGLLDWSPQDFQGTIIPGNGSYRLLPAETADRQGSVRICLDQDSLLLKSILIREPSGDSTTIELSDIVVNKPLPDRILEFSLPEGTTVNRLQQP